MHQSLTHQEENTIGPCKVIHKGNQLPALPQPHGRNIPSLRIQTAEITFQQDTVPAKPNVTSRIIPFEPIFEDLDFDLVTILNEVENSQKTENQTTTSHQEHTTHNCTT